MGELDRRNFLKKAVTGTASVGLLGFTLDSKASALPTNIHSGKKGELIFRTLGRTGIKIPIVSMGVMNSDVPELLKESYKLGIRHFDTAWNYQGGNNEKMIGNVLKELNVNRGDIIIGTKIFLNESANNPVSGKSAKELFLLRFDESLKRLHFVLPFSKEHRNGN